MTQLQASRKLIPLTSNRPNILRWNSYKTTTNNIFNSFSNWNNQTTHHMQPREYHIICFYKYQPHISTMLYFTFLFFKFLFFTVKRISTTANHVIALPSTPLLPLGGSSEYLYLVYLSIFFNRIFSSIKWFIFI